MSDCETLAWLNPWYSDEYDGEPHLHALDKLLFIYCAVIERVANDGGYSDSTAKKLRGFNGKLIEALGSHQGSLGCKRNPIAAFSLHSKALRALTEVVIDCPKDSPRPPLAHTVSMLLDSFEDWSSDYPEIEFLPRPILDYIVIQNLLFDNCSWPEPAEIQGLTPISSSNLTKSELREIPGPSLNSSALYFPLAIGALNIFRMNWLLELNAVCLAFVDVSDSMDVIAQDIYQDIVQPLEWMNSELGEPWPRWAHSLIPCPAF